MEINQKHHVYLVGKFYDSSLEDVPNKESNYDLIVYAHPKKEKSRVISSLEGIFVTDKEFLKYFLKGEGNPVCRRDQMEDFEEKYSGKFFLNF